MATFTSALSETPSAVPQSETLSARMYQNLTGASFDRSNAPAMESVVYQIFEEIVSACECRTDPFGNGAERIQKLSSLIGDLSKKAPINLGPVLLEGIVHLRLSPEEQKVDVDASATSRAVGDFLTEKSNRISSSFSSRLAADPEEIIEALKEEIENPYRDEKGRLSHLEFLLDELEPSLCRTFIDQTIEAIRKSLYETGVRKVARKSMLIRTLFQAIGNSLAWQRIPPFKFRSSQEIQLK